jgi:hypothetical protein
LPGNHAVVLRLFLCLTVLCCPGSVGRDAKGQTAVPLGVYLSSGSRVRLPMRMTRFKDRLAISFLIQKLVIGNE